MARARCSALSDAQSTRAEPSAADASPLPMSHPSSSPAKVAKRTPASSPASDAPAASASFVEVIALDEDSMSDDNAAAAGTGARAATTNGSAPAASSTSAASSSASHHVSLIPAFTSASFDYVDRAAINKFLLCSFCNAPFFQPIEHNTCRIAFCIRCVSSASPSSAPVSCPECNESIKPGRNTQPCSKITERQLDALEIVCKACEQRMTRKEYETHWREACPVACPFAAAGCKQLSPRSTINAHIDSCSFAPVQCEASTFGCSWTCQREAQDSHSKSCAWVACLPSFQALQRAHAKATEEMAEENKRLRIALSTREGQLQSYLALHKGAAASAERSARGASAATTAVAATDAPLYPLGTVLDALDTESQSVCCAHTCAGIARSDNPHSARRLSARSLSLTHPCSLALSLLLLHLLRWMLAKVIKVDTTRKLYRITYLGSLH